MLEEGKGRELLEMLEKALKESDPADLGEDAKYTRRVFQSQSETGAKASGIASGDLLGVLQENQQAELIARFELLTNAHREAVLAFVGMLMRSSSYYHQSLR
jgi:hypothetical protein